MSERDTVRILVEDSSPGVGGGQRWSKDFADWLRSRGHDVVFRPGSEVLKHSVKDDVDFYFDMAPLGDVNRYPRKAKTFLWCHVPSSLKHPAHVIPNTTIIASSVWSQGEIKKVWGVDSKVLMPFGRAATSLHTNTSGHYILFLGRLTAAKGVFKALNLHDEMGNCFNLVLAGATWSTKTEDLNILRHRVNQTRRVTLFEDFNPSEVPNLYRHTQAFLQVAGSDVGPAEAFGLAAADAYLSGIPVMGYPSGAIGEWLPEDWWFDPSDVASFKSLMNRLSNTSYTPDSVVVRKISDVGFLGRAKEVLGSWV